jgi:hypothetical protein
MAQIPSKDIPQANSLEMVSDLVAYMNEGITERSELASQLEINPRQVLYYQEAARILGWIAEHDDSYVVTLRGRSYLKAIKPADTAGLLSEAVRDTEVFKRLLDSYTEPELSRSNIMNFLREETTLTGTTVGRRADSIVAWLRTISSIDPEDYRSLAKRAIERAPTQFRAYRSVEQGTPHQKLKDAITKNPSLLGEQLTLVRPEYQFPTNDRIDILFIDAESRFLAVEVEVDVGPLDMAGLLQAVKYQAMLRVQFGRPLSGVRAMLVARSIDPVMQQRAARYGIEIHEIKSII